MSRNKEIKLQQETERLIRECASCDQLPNRDALYSMIRETHLAVVGNSELGLPGLVTRVEKVEKKQSRMSLYAICTVCVIAGAYFGLPRLLELLVHNTL